MYRTCHEPMLASMGIPKAIIYHTCIIYTYPNIYPIIKTPTVEHGWVRSKQFYVTRYFFMTPAHVSTPIYPTGTQGIPAVSGE